MYLCAASVKASPCASSRSRAAQRPAAVPGGVCGCGNVTGLHDRARPRQLLTCGGDSLGTSSDSAVLQGTPRWEEGGGSEERDIVL